MKKLNKFSLELCETYRKYLTWDFVSSLSDLRDQNRVNQLKGSRIVFKRFPDKFLVTQWPKLTKIL